MENFCMNTNAGLIPFGFDITGIDVANKYSCLCEATYKHYRLLPIRVDY